MKVLQSVAARRIVPNCCRSIPQNCTNPSQRAELRWIVTEWTSESAAIGRSAPNCAKLLQIDPAKMQQSDRSAPKCAELLQIDPVKVQQSGWSRECATIGRTTQNGAELLQIGPAEGHQSVHARRITPNCCRLTPPSIYSNSARCNRLLHYRRINLQQFGAIRRAATDCCTFTGSICNNSAQFGALRRIGAL